MICCSSNQYKLLAGPLGSEQASQLTSVAGRVISLHNIDLDRPVAGSLHQVSLLSSFAVVLRFML